MFLLSCCLTPYVALFFLPYAFARSDGEVGVCDAHGNFGCTTWYFEYGTDRQGSKFENRLRCADPQPGLMPWAMRPDRSDKYTLRTESGTTQFRAGELHTLVLEVNDADYKYRGLLLHAVNSDGVTVGEWDFPEEGETLFFSPHTCPQAALHKTADLKPFTVRLHWRAPNNPPDEVTFRCLIKRGPANHGWFHYPNGANGDLKLTADITPESADHFFIVGEAGESCDETCDRNGHERCDSEHMRSMNSEQATLEKLGSTFACPLPILEGCPNPGATSNSCTYSQGNDATCSFSEAGVKPICACYGQRAPTTVDPEDNPTDGGGTGRDPRIHELRWTSGFSDANARKLTAFPGDTIRFTWTGTHNVYRLEPNRTMFDMCDFTDAVLLGSESPLDVMVADDITVYFACKVAGHCQGGQKLAVSSDGFDIADDFEWQGMRRRQEWRSRQNVNQDDDYEGNGIPKGFHQKVQTQSCPFSKAKPKKQGDGEVVRRRAENASSRTSLSVTGVLLTLMTTCFMAQGPTLPVYLGLGALLLGNLPGVNAHNWIGTTGRASRQASTSQPCRGRKLSDTHAQVGPDQGIDMMWSTGHPVRTNSVVVIKGTDYQWLQHPDFVDMVPYGLKSVGASWLL